MHVEPLTLTGSHIRLEPLREAHVPALVAAQADSIWQWMIYGMVNTEAKMRALVQRFLTAQAAGTDLPFVVIAQTTVLQPIGMTRFFYIQPEYRSVEIGGTWYAPAYQRTAVNTECKLLMLHHAFEVWHCVRVQLKTDVLNERSQRAIERLGAVREGRLRNHIILPDGRGRDSFIYSIIDSEWPAVKENLRRKLEL